MRNIILTFAAGGSLAFVAFTPALAVGLECSDYANLDRCPIYEGDIRARPRTIKCLPCTSGIPGLPEPPSLPLTSPERIEWGVGFGRRPFLCPHGGPFCCLRCWRVTADFVVRS